MEPVGLAVGIVGLAGLFSSCLEAVGRVQAYKSFATDSRGLDVQFNAARTRLETWGSAVGFGRGTHTGEQHAALNDEKIRKSAADLFECIKAICDAHDARKTQSFRAAPADLISGTSRSLISPGASRESKSKKLAWSLGGRLERQQQVNLLRDLVEDLHNLVPPDARGVQEHHCKPGTPTRSARSGQETVKGSRIRLFDPL
jgi:hypothetical protein